MECVQEHGEGMADECHASRKNTIKRTFVLASDAVASKVQKKGITELPHDPLVSDPPLLDLPSSNPLVKPDPSLSRPPLFADFPISNPPLLPDAPMSRPPLLPGFIISNPSLLPNQLVNKAAMFPGHPRGSLMPEPLISQPPLLFGPHIQLQLQDVALFQQAVNNRLSEYWRSVGVSFAHETKNFKPIIPARTIEDIYNNIVVMHNSFETTARHFNNLRCGKMELIHSSTPEGKVLAKIVVGQLVLVEYVSHSRKPARRLVRKLFAKSMGEKCYKIFTKKSPLDVTCNNVERKALNRAVDDQKDQTNNYSIGGNLLARASSSTEKRIDESNVGFRLLQKLGWKGGSLGPKNQGIVDPVKCEIWIGRYGLGNKAEEKIRREEKEETKRVYDIDVEFYYQLMENYRNSGIEYDLVFSEEFTDKERELFCNMAKRLNLKTRIHSKKGSSNFILVGRTLTPHEILDRVIVRQDPVFSEIYRVEPPRNMDDVGQYMNYEADDFDDEDRSDQEEENVAGKTPNEDTATNKQSQQIINYEASSSNSCSQEIYPLKPKFAPVHSIRSIVDVYNNIILLDGNFKLTKEVFDMLGCGQQLEVVLTARPDRKFLAEVKVAHYVLCEVVAEKRRWAEVQAEHLFMKDMRPFCYRLEKSKKKSHRVGKKAIRPITEDACGAEIIQKLCASPEGTLHPDKCPIKYQIGFQGHGRKTTPKLHISKKENIHIASDFYENLLKNFRDNETEYDLVFSPEFTMQERKLFHELAHKLGLDVQSIGSEENGKRQVVISGLKLAYHDILNRVLVDKDPFFCEMYRVIPPTKTEFKS